MEDIKAKRGPQTSSESQSLSISLKLASDGGCQLSDDEQNRVAHLLRDAGGPAHIAINEARPLMQLVASGVPNYPPGSEDITFISSVEPLTTYLTAA